MKQKISEERKFFVQVAGVEKGRLFFKVFDAGKNHGILLFWEKAFVFFSEGKLEFFEKIEENLKVIKENDSKGVMNGESWGKRNERRVDIVFFDKLFSRGKKELGNFFWKESIGKVIENSTSGSFIQSEEGSYRSVLHQVQDVINVFIERSVIGQCFSLFHISGNSSLIAMHKTLK